jgi:chromosome partitioning protein
MPLKMWEVVPLMGSSISPSSVQEGLGWPVQVSRETLAPGGTKGHSPEDVVSRETTPSSLGWPGVESGAATAAVKLAEDPKLGAGASGDIANATSAVPAPKAATPTDMTPLETVRRVLGLDPGTRTESARPRLLAFANQKGGVGKTTSAVNIAAALSLLGYEVLVVDMDPQANASTALGIEHPSGTPGTYEVLVNGKSLLDVVQPAPGIPGLTVAPATVDLSGAEIELVPEMGRETRLRTALGQYLPEHEQRSRRLDFVIVDCPPSLGLLTINALTAVDEIVIPLQCEYYALEGLGQLLGSIELVKEHLNPNLGVAGIVLTMFDGRTKLAPQVAMEARSHFAELVFEVEIPRSVRISEAPSYSQTVLTYDPGSAGARAYVECARELVAR